MPRPAATPIGLLLARTAKSVSRAFDDALAAAGGSLPVWLILLALKTREHANQRQLAGAVGIEEATLTHHLAAMEERGLIERRRDTSNRRVQLVQLTSAGEAMFLRLVGAATAHDARLRAGLSAEEISVLGELLTRLAANVDAHAEAGLTPAGGRGSK